MARYYDMDKLKEMIEAKADTLIKGKEVFLYVAKWLDLLPAADVVPKSEGEWRKRGNEKTCSLCKFIYYSNNDEWNFCPNCGAKMSEGRKA